MEIGKRVHCTDPRRHSAAESAAIVTQALRGRALHVRGVRIVGTHPRRRSDRPAQHPHGRGDDAMATTVR
ncbi:hypothetical protein M3S04_20215 [Xanthomonas sp. PPL139]|uniref:hypothetical protein n=1 Tax=unclassified Xanthomonas TaxID=2643310 RepID=UPI0033B122C5